MGGSQEPVRVSLRSAHAKEDSNTQAGEDSATLPRVRLSV